MHLGVRSEVSIRGLLPSLAPFQEAWLLTFIYHIFHLLQLLKDSFTEDEARRPHQVTQVNTGRHGHLRPPDALCREDPTVPKCQP